MLTIGVRELKARLSAVLREVQAGETVLVTDRGRVVAELRSPSREPAAQTRMERRLSQLSADGLLRIAERPHEPYRASPVKKKAGTAKMLLDEDRADR